MKIKFNLTPLTFLFYSCFFLIPYYKFASDSFQPLDIIIVLIIFAFIFNTLSTDMFIANKTLIYWASFYVLGIILILINYVKFNQGIFQIPLLIIFLYSLSILVSFFYLFTKLSQRASPQQFLNQLINAILFSIIIPLFIHHPALGLRSLLSFNNPNQLGYFTILNIGILFYTKLLANDLNIKLNKTKFLTALIINAIFCLMCLSRASLASVFFMLFFLSWNAFSFKNNKTKFILGLIVIIILLFIFYYLSYDLIRFVFSSRGNAGELDVGARFFDGLSYNFNNLWIFLLGLGQVNSPARPLEFHNSFLEIFNELGFFGLLILVVLTIKLFYDLMRLRPMYLVPIISFWFFNLFNYGLRFRYANIFLAFVFFVMYYRKSQLINIKHHQTTEITS